ncbi:hypothetical protein B0J15DRAFT_501243 [Fusarium solani]|uniref:Non-ribosomal peptide synthetase n=1 Tax=Fusarium solani TaxID=169388 RepID=A0A9P9GR98_FUSSL|nr:uncharacterized protein B0J15DRAFT_501243 [Fusarium solani]KAH7243871.1 hypothetical protein B0J15DRAFT_501243 [Fusarium solani]
MREHAIGEEMFISQPTPRNRAYVLDREERPFSEGVSGLLWARAPSVSRSYVDLDSDTAEEFKLDPFVDGGPHMHNTGDIGRWRPDGSLETPRRVDDQVKAKGLRLEVDGVSALVASASDVSRAAALLINGEIHAFASPRSCKVAVIAAHPQNRLSYFAVPAQIHLFEDRPVTANGKADSQELQTLATNRVKNGPIQLAGKGKRGNIDTRIEMHSQTPISTLSIPAERRDLTQDLPHKKLAQSFRGLRHRVFIVYRTLFTLVCAMNLAALILVLVLRPGSQWLETIAATNLTTTVLARQDMVINVLFTIACSVPKRAPLWIRARCAKIYHLGGVHSGPGSCAGAWLIISTIKDTICKRTRHDGQRIEFIGRQAVSWLLCGLFCLLVGLAWPSFRKRHHDMFERFHRFAGWASLALLWVHAMLGINDTRPHSQTLVLTTVRCPQFWLLVVATCSIASSWLSLRKVPVDAEVLSDHAVRLHFNYTVPVNGSFTRVSQRPLLEWHSFATIAAPEASGSSKGFSVIVSNAGDWTRACIQKPPAKIWVRGIPTFGLMRIATLFNRLVCIATGSGIGPLLGHINHPSCPTQLIWSASRPEATFGREIIDLVREKIPDAIIYDTKIYGRPDLVRMGLNLALNFGAEAVIIIANEKITKKVVHEIESQGLPAYGAIWDS